MRLGRSVKASCRAMCAIALFGTLTLGHILVGREPAATGDGFVDNGNRAAVRQIDDVVESLALGDAFGKPCSVFVRIAREAAALNFVPEKIAKRAAGPNDFRRECVQFYVTFIAEY